MVWSSKYFVLYGEIMKIYSILFMVASTAHAADQFNIILKPKWRDLEQDNKKIIDFGGRWILAGSITFKKHGKEPLFVDALSFHWNGKNIDNLIASLYKKSSKTFLPIEKNLICDGIWNKTKQTLLFNFEEKETLSPTTTFYLVLTIPSDLENILFDGTFSLEECCLPKPFKQCAQAAQLSLTNNSAIKSSTSPSMT